MCTVSGRSARQRVHLEQHSAERAWCGSRNSTISEGAAGFTGYGKTHKHVSKTRFVSGHDFEACPERSRRVP